MYIWKCLQKHLIFLCLYALLSCMFCFRVWTHVCCHLMSKVQIVRTFKNKILIQTFEKWYNISYRNVSYVKSETSDIWRTGSIIFKPFGERVEENHIYDLVKPNSTVKTGCNVCYSVFLENGTIAFKSKI